MRYPMQISQDPLSSLAFPLLNITEENSYVELTSDRLIVKESTLFDESFPLSDLGRGELISWEWYNGLGVRTDFQGTVAVITSLEKVIAIPVLQERRLFISLLGPLGLQVPCDRLVFSLRDADTFLTNFNAGRVNPQQGPTNVPIE